jgi:hypothetical protein
LGHFAANYVCEGFSSPAISRPWLPSAQILKVLCKN